MLIFRCNGTLSYTIRALGMIYDLSDGQTPGSAEKIRGDRDPAEMTGSQNIYCTMVETRKNRFSKTLFVDIVVNVADAKFYVPVQEAL